MQDSSQQESQNQSSIFSPEAHSPEHIQTFVPAQEITQPHFLLQDMIIYPARKQLLSRTILSLIAFILLLLCLPLLFVLNLISHTFLLGINDLIPLILLVAGIVFVGWLTWEFLSLLLHVRNPILTISREGIVVEKMFAFSRFFISWANIESIYTYKSLHTYICINPKDVGDFLSHFTSLERFYRNLYWRNAPISISEIFLEKPIEMIFHEIHANFGTELVYYNVRMDVC